MREKIKQAIKTYNKYRKNIAHAELLEIDKNMFRVEFNGTFHNSCCMDEYLKDLIHELEKHGIIVELKNHKQTDTNTTTAKYITKQTTQKQH